jgi:DNA-binding NtrC family response regulator
LKGGGVDPPTLPPSTGSHLAGRDDGQAPGLVVVFAQGAPSAHAITFGATPLELGRSVSGAGQLDDARASRLHALVAFEAGRWVVTDLGSQNGTFVDGKQVAAHTPTGVDRVIRIGDSLLVPWLDVRPFARNAVRMIDGFLRGPAMQSVIEDAVSAARTGSTLHIRGESGSGKEGIAQVFHRAGAAHGALVAVNCAAIPQAIAERLLFGVRRGAYSGADADATGYVQEADGGTLFLDEVTELDLQVQAKLLRALESREILPLGASRPRKVDFALCTATNKDVRALVGAGAFREDLYFRLASPTVTVPALRDRPEEIPALIAEELARQEPAMTAHVSLVELCLLRPWPGNVRELLSEIRAAARAAHPTGTRVTGRHLPALAGSAFGSDAAMARTGSLAAGSPGSVAHPKHIPDDDPAWDRRVLDALRSTAGNVAASARALGVHRTQLRRFIERRGIDPAAYRDDDAE